MSARTERHNDALGRTVQDAVQTLGADLAKTTLDAGDALRKTSKLLNSSASEALQGLEGKSAEAVEGLKQQMRSHPMTYVAAAAGVGLLVGFLLRRH